MLKTRSLMRPGIRMVYLPHNSCLEPASQRPGHAPGPHV